MPAPDFDVEKFLARPLTARLATAGPTVRPVWYLWEQGSFFILSGPWAKVPALIAKDPNVALVVDVCEPDTGVIRQVTARGIGRIQPLDLGRARRLLVRQMARRRSHQTQDAARTNAPAR